MIILPANSFTLKLVLSVMFLVLVYWFVDIFLFQSVPIVHDPLHQETVLYDIGDKHFSPPVSLEEWEHARDYLLYDEYHDQAEVSHERQGNLAQILHGDHGGLLHWDTWLHIVVQATKGFLHLHEELNLDCGVNCNNILVGYIKDYASYRRAKEGKLEVFKFGIVLLELVSGEKLAGNGEKWVMKMTRAGVKKVMNARAPLLRLNTLTTSSTWLSYAWLIKKSAQL